MHIKNLYYSLEKNLLMGRVKDHLELNLVKFKSGAAISVVSSLSILVYYLQSTVVECSGHKYLQKEGVCIGSGVALILSEIYLSGLDSSVSSFLGEMPETLGFVQRYVDDILERTAEEKLGRDLERIIRKYSPEWEFTLGREKGGNLQFLDFQIHVANGLCWEYAKLVPKPILLCSSCHCRTVKCSIIGSLIDNVLNRSCVHYVSKAVEKQMCRPRNAGFSSDGIIGQIKN